jgi:hypothetical protein
MSLTDDQIERIAETAAKKAVGEMFEVFGVDLSTPSTRKEFAEDMNFVRVARVGSSRFRSMTITTIWTSFLTGVGYLIWKGAVAMGIVIK